MNTSKSLKDMAKELMQPETNPVVEQFCHSLKQEVYEHMADFTEHHKKDDQQSKQKAMKDMECIKDMLKVLDRTIQLKNGTLGCIPETIKAVAKLKEFEKMDSFGKIMSEFGIDNDDDDGRERFMKNLKNNPEMQRRFMEKMGDGAMLMAYGHHIPFQSPWGNDMMMRQGVPGTGPNGDRRYRSPRNYGNEDMETYGYYDDDLEDAFRDRRGRRHYDNGRFAPQNYGGNNGYNGGGNNGGNGGNYSPSNQLGFTSTDPSSRMDPNNGNSGNNSNGNSGSVFERNKR